MSGDARETALRALIEAAAAEQGLLLAVDALGDALDNLPENGLAAELLAAMTGVREVMHKAFELIVPEPLRSAAALDETLQRR